MVYLPDDRVLVAGDILVHRIMPNFRDAYVKNWVNTLEEIGRLDFQTAIPGHGPLMSKADALKFKRMMAKLYAGVEAGYRKGLTDSEIRATLDLRDWKRLAHFEDTMGGNISRTYLEVEAANF
jgi:glyoxylase-like metal-dependent hydrolase (beta-lactamase superfamily II)